jgi:4-amino-4-deoxy-L-arabinose transferase-like glycosyltransferase
MSTAAARTNTGSATMFLLVTGAVSVGVHAGLAPEHLHERPPLGAAFVAAATAVAAAVSALVLRPLSAWPPRLLGALLGSIAVAYVLTRLVALPPLDPEQEPFELLGVSTSALEAAGLVVAVRLGRPRRRGRLSSLVTTGGTP